MKKAIFAAGCFWHVEAEFRKIPGVINVTSGYTGGRTKNPTYPMVCTGLTGHAESVLVEYDPKKASYKSLLERFFLIHNPTTKNRQGLDIGSQYRSAIFYYDSTQEKEAKEALLQEQNRYEKKIVTQLLPAEEFHPAEEHHQRYYEKHGIIACKA